MYEGQNPCVLMIFIILTWVHFSSFDCSLCQMLKEVWSTETYAWTYASLPADTTAATGDLCQICIHTIKKLKIKVKQIIIK